MNRLRGFNPASIMAIAPAGKVDASALVDSPNAAPANEGAKSVPGHGPVPIVFKRPLVSTWTAMSLIEVDAEEEIIKLIEDGRMRWAFNIATAGASKRLVRILGQSINEYLAGQEAPPINAAEDFARTMDLIFPSRHAMTRAVAVAHAWNTSRDHILNLCREGQLRVAEGSDWRRGPGGSPIVETASAIEFLKQRRVV